MSPQKALGKWEGVTPILQMGRLRRRRIKKNIFSTNRATILISEVATHLHAQLEAPWAGVFSLCGSCGLLHTSENQANGVPEAPQPPPPPNQWPFLNMVTFVIFPRSHCDSAVEMVPASALLPTSHFHSCLFLQFSSKAEIH